MTEQTAAPHFWALIDVLPVAVLYKEQARKAVFANKAALSLLGLPLQQPVLSISDIQQLNLQNADNGEPFSLLHNPILLALGGSELQQPLLISGKRLMLHSKLVSLSFTLHSSVLISLCPNSAEATSTTVQNPNHNLAELQEALAFDKLISLISTELINVKASKLDQHINDALAALGEFCQADRSYVFRFSQDLTQISNTHEWVRTGIKSYKDNLQQIPEQAMPYFFNCMRRDLVFAVNKVSSLPESASAEKLEFETEDIQSVLCCAMQADNKLLGFVGCDMVARQRSWTSNDLRRMRLIGDMLANALQNVSYHQSLQQLTEQLQRANAQLQQQAHQDGLTGIANRRHFDQHLQNELQRARRHQQPLALLMLDIDYFKAYNDHYGHQAGDQALQQVAKLLQQQCRRQGELAARYGGEEFAVILPGSSAEDARDFARRIQQELELLAIAHHASAISTLLTCSIGCCSILASRQHDSTALLAQADKALYQAKAAGRNTVVQAEDTIRCQKIN